MFIENNSTSTAPHISMRDEGGGSTSFGITFDNVICELPSAGGFIHLYSIRHPLFTSCVGDDPTTINAPAIFIDTAAAGSSRNPFGSTFINCWIREGDATYPDIKVVPGASGTQTTLIGCDIKYLDTDTKQAVMIGTIVTNLVGNTDPIDIFSGVYNVPLSGSVKHVSGITVPEIQSGNTNIITTGSSSAVVFPIGFSGTPTVVVSHVAGTDKAGTAQATSITSSGFTAHNFGTSSTVVAWIATYTI
jgi:hypothetical protein